MAIGIENISGKCSEMLAIAPASPKKVRNVAMLSGLNIPRIASMRLSSLSSTCKPWILLSARVMMPEGSDVSGPVLAREFDALFAAALWAMSPL
jgi:hypothetical protein